jgi:hypothetical protein
MLLVDDAWASGELWQQRHTVGIQRDIANRNNGG